MQMPESRTSALQTPTVSDAAYMARALQLAAHGLMTTGVNPRVGCVLVKDGQVIGAVGVSGVKSNEDAQIAKAGIAAIGL